MKTGNTGKQLRLALDDVDGEVEGSRLGGGSAPPGTQLRATWVAPSLEPSTRQEEPQGPAKARDVRQLGLDVGERPKRHRWDDDGDGMSCRWCGLQRLTRERIEIERWTVDAPLPRAVFFYLERYSSWLLLAAPPCRGVELPAQSPGEGHPLSPELGSPHSGSGAEPRERHDQTNKPEE